MCLARPHTLKSAQPKRQSPLLSRVCRPSAPDTNSHRLVLLEKPGRSYHAPFQALHDRCSSKANSSASTWTCIIFREISCSKLLLKYFQSGVLARKKKSKKKKARSRRQQWKQKRNNKRTGEHIQKLVSKEHNLLSEKAGKSSTCPGLNGKELSPTRVLIFLN